MSGTMKELEEALRQGAGVLCGISVSDADGCVTAEISTPFEHPSNGDSIAVWAVQASDLEWNLTDLAYASGEIDMTSDWGAGRVAARMLAVLPHLGTGALGPRLEGGEIKLRLRFRADHGVAERARRLLWGACRVAQQALRAMSALLDYGTPRTGE